MWIAVALIGGAGAIARFVVDGTVAARAGRSWPFGTLAINLTGSFVLGLLVGRAVDGDAYILAGTAAIGTYTTLSTWMYETQRLVEDGANRAAAANIVVSFALGVGIAEAGRLIGGLL
ncbi:fluoride efflux transporter CrcB [Baekduia sp.]|uniref:fluoride efflux transporter CrcB n=1 Tax=Baekduia sp. TaxID=2600305 RepID=UPI0032C228C9